MEKGFSLSEEAWLAFVAQDPNVQQYAKVAAAVQGQCSAPCYLCREKKSYYLDIAGHHFSRGVDRIGFRKEPNPVPATSGVSEIAAFLHLLLLMGLQLLRLPVLVSSVSASSCLFTRCYLHASCCTVLFKSCAVRLKCFLYF